MPTSTTARPDPQADPPIREVVGLLPDEEALDAAVGDLLVKDFERRNLSVFSAKDEAADALHGLSARLADFEDDPGAPRGIHISRASLGDAEGGIIGGLMYLCAIIAAGAAAGAGAGTGSIIMAAVVAGILGGLIGWALARWLDRRYRGRIQEQLRHGGLLLWVRAEDAEHERIASEILNRHSARDVHVHEVPA